MSEIERAIEFFEGQIAEVKEAMKPPVLVPVEHLEKCRVSYSLAIEALKEKQQREDAGALTGTWIDKHYEDAPWAHRVICSVCGLVTGDRSNYCPCCGARMTKPQSAEGG